MKANFPFLKIAIVILGTFTIGQLSAQTQTGIFGKKNLVGYKADFLLEPFKPIHTFSYERMSGRRTNLGISTFFNSTGLALNDKSTYFSNYQNVIVRHEGQDRSVRGMDATLTQRKRGFEIYIKRFSKRNQMRNFGLFWSYKFGQIRSVNALKEGSIVYVQDTLNQYETEKLIVDNPGRNITKSTYVAFEIGRLVPFHHDRLLFSYSLTLNGFLTGLQEVYNSQTLNKYLEVEANNNINNTHIMTINFGLSYAF